MSSKRRLRRNACRGKRPYPDKAAADAAVRLQLIRTRRAGERETKGFLNAYHCPFGGHWHIGHT